MSRLQKKGWILIVILFSISGLLAFNSCGDSLSVPDRNENEAEDDALSALLYLNGTKITTKYSEWPVPENEVPSIDTTHIGFLVNVHALQGEENKVRVYGLDGADVGKRENYLFSGCEHPDDCKIIGSLTDENLEINITNNSRTYHAEGFIYQTYDPYVELTATYNFQNTTIEYELEGGVFEE